MDDFSTHSRLEEQYERIRQLTLDDDMDQALYLLTQIENPFSLLLRLARELALDLALALALVLALTLAHARDQDHDLDHDLALALALALSFALDLTRSRERTHDLDRALVLARDLDRDLTLAHELAVDLNLDLDFADILKVLEQSHHMIQFIRAALSVEAQRIEVTTVIVIKYPSLTTHSLAQNVLPYLNQMLELQRILTEMRGEPWVEPTIRELSQRSALFVTFTGKLSEAVHLIRNILIPWRQQRIKQFTDLEAAEKRFEIAQAEAELQNIYRRSAQTENNLELIIHNHEPSRTQLEQVQLETERLRLRLEQEKTDLAWAVTERFATELPEQDRLIYINPLVKSINFFIASPLEFD